MSTADISSISLHFRESRIERRSQPGTALLATAGPSALERSLAIACLAISVAIFAALVPFARAKLLPLPAFIPAYETALIIIDLITAVLLVQQFVQLKSAALLALAAGYLFDGLMIIPHALTFPGLVTPTGWLDAGMHTTAWIYMFWHGGFPLFIIAYGVLARRDAQIGGGSAVAYAVGAGIAVITAAVLLTLLATIGEDLLPPMMAGNTASINEMIAAGVVWLLTLAGLAAVVLKRPYSVLDLWLIVVMVAWLADIALSAVLNAGRFDLGFYGGRAYGLLAAGGVLTALLLETGVLYRRLAVSTEVLRERAQGLDLRVREQSGELANVNRHLGAILEASPLAIFMLDSDGRVVLWTSAAERIFGYTRAETIGGLPPYLVERDQDELHSDYSPTGESAHAFESFETKRRRADGEIIDVSVRGAEVKDEAGRTLGVMYAVADITERKRLEQQLQQAQKMEALGNLTGGLAHDFNNHLNVITLNLDLLREQVADDPESAELANEALDAASRGAELIRRLLAFARRQPLQPQRSDVNKLVFEIEKLLERTIGETVKITLDLKREVWPTIIDPAQLESSIMNLANNARDAMPGGGELRITTDNRQLDEDYASAHVEVTPGDYALVEVSDTGSGMSSEILQRVFEPFFTTKDVGRGTGLGLSMVYGFIKQSGGHINVYSEVGVGTTIRLYLPRCDVDAAAQSEDEAAKVARGGGETILAVEDNASLRRVVVRQLTEIGYRVIEVEDAQAALDILATEPVDLLFTDVILKNGVSGYELAHLVSERWPDVKLVLTSGFPELRNIGDKQLSDIRLLSKPYRREDIARIIGEALAETPS